MTQWNVKLQSNRKWRQKPMGDDTRSSWPNLRGWVMPSADSPGGWAGIQDRIRWTSYGTCTYCRIFTRAGTIFVKLACELYYARAYSALLWKLIEGFRFPVFCTFYFCSAPLLYIRIHSHRLSYSVLILLISPCWAGHDWWLFNASYRCWPLSSSNS